jgi:hypothetical protein
VPVALNSVSISSTNGGAIYLQTNSVVYVPPSNYVGSDRFAYTINDGQGLVASAFVLVQVRPASIISGNISASGANLGGFQVTFGGTPGHTYTLQRAPSVNGPWSNLGAVTVGPDGFGQFLDPGPASNSAFYRTVAQ